jgi:hypothetical protein
MFISLSFLIISVFAANSSSTTASSEGPTQINSKDVIGWIVTFSATIPPAVGLFYTAMSLRNDSNARYIQTFSQIEKEISDIENHTDRSSPIPSNKRTIWEINFLNTMHKNAFLMRSKRYPKDLLDIFKKDFGYARHLIAENASRKRDFSQILELCNEKQWPPYDADHQ